MENQRTDSRTEQGRESEETLSPNLPNAVNPTAQQHRGRPAGTLSSFDMRNMSTMLPEHDTQPRQQYSNIPQQYQSISHVNQEYTYSYPAVVSGSTQPLHPYTTGYTQQYLPVNPTQRHYIGHRTPEFNQQGFTNIYPGDPRTIQQSQYPIYPIQHGPSFVQGTPSAYLPDPGTAVYGTRQVASTIPPAITVRRESSNTSNSTPSTLRGPPRKPKQSGHALWVGNLPPGTHILELKDHFSRDATDDIESVFLISKSNCAFVNYKNEESCIAAVSRFHDSRFKSVRLVCRLRRGGVSIGPQNAPPASVPLTQTTSEDKTTGVDQLADVAVPEAQIDNVQPRLTKEKFFVVKSLTLEDLDRSVQTGLWATQAHNEESWNEAFAAAENVYLIFSANKSGEYFGFARMDSSISDNVALETEMNTQEAIPSTVPTRAQDAPRTIVTSPTATAPQGYIIDDSARGTIFWEAESSTLTLQSTTEAEPEDISGDDSSRSPAPTTFGRPFRITWMSTDRVPFYRTRGLRNPYNSNREVKIARDGTEIEPNVGRKLLNLFEQQAQINAAARNLPPQQYGFPSQTPPYGSAQAQYGYFPQATGYGRPY